MALRLHEHIENALAESARRVVAIGAREGLDLRERMAEWVETAHERIECELSIDGPGRRGRIDTRSLAVVVYLVASDPDNAVQRAHLLTVRARDLIKEDGSPVAASEDARTLLLQLGHGIPDSPAGLVG
jgi:hypothetical protein